MARSTVRNSTDNIAWSGGPLLYSQTAASVMCWFKAPSAPSGGDYPTLFKQEAAFNITVTIFIATDANIGKLVFFWRSPTGTAVGFSATRWDDDVWHRLLFVRRTTSPFTQAYVDGASVYTNTTDPGTDATAAAQQEWGGDSLLPSTEGGWGGRFARCTLLSGVTLTPEEADSFLYTGRIGRQLSLWLEMVGASPEPDWSGNVRNGTLTGSAVADHAPCAPPFAFTTDRARNKPRGIAWIRA